KYTNVDSESSTYSQVTVCTYVSSKTGPQRSHISATPDRRLDAAVKAVSTCSPATGRLRADPGEQLLRDLLRGLLNDRLYGICPLGFAEGMAVYGLFPRINAGQSPKRAVARTGAYKAGRGLIKGALYGPDVSALLRIRAAGRCTLPVRPIGRKEHKGSLYGGTVTLRVDSLLHTRQSRGDS